MINVLTNRTKDVIIQILNDFFREKSGMNPIIRYSYAMERRAWPLIEVMVTSSSYKPMGIGMDFYDDVRNDCGFTIGQRYGFMSSMTVGLKITSQSTDERQVIADQVTAALFFTERDKLYAKGVRITGSSLGSEEVHDSNQAFKEYSVTISLNLFTETFYDDITEYIKSIGVRATGDTSAEWPDLECEP